MMKKNSNNYIRIVASNEEDIIDFIITLIDRSIDIYTNYLKRLDIELPKALLNRALKKLQKESEKIEESNIKVHDEYCCPNCGQCILIDDILEEYLT